MNPILSIVIATQGRPERLRRVLDALAGQTETNFELIVAADGIEPPSLPPVGVRAIAVPSRGKGASVTRNTALQHATAPRTLIIDDDSLTHPTTVAKHAQAGNDCRIGIRRHVKREIVDALPTDRVVTWDELLPHIVKEDMRTNTIARIRDKYKQGIGDQHSIAYTCHLSFPTEVAKNIGGFWEEMVWSGYEDLEFACRLYRAGVTFTIPEDLPAVLHLDHPICPGQTKHFKANCKRYCSTKNNSSILSRNGGAAHFRRDP